MSRVASIVLATLATILFLRLAQEVVIPLLLAWFLFFALNPIVRWLVAWRLPRLVASAVVLAVVLGGLGYGLFSLRDEALEVIEEIPVAAARLRQTLEHERRQSAPGPIDKVQDAAAELEAAATAALGEPEVRRGTVRVQVEEAPLDVTRSLVWGSMTLFGAAGQWVMILFLTYFLLLSDDLLKAKLVHLAGPTLTRQRITVQLLDEIGRQVGRFLGVTALGSALVGLASWALLWWLGVERAALWGLAAAVFNTVPYFGPVLVTAGLTVVAYLQFGDLGPAATAGAVALLVTTLEGWLLTPWLLGRAARMNQVAIFCGLLFWSWMWGLWGMLLAVPMMMVMKAVCDRVEGLRPLGELVSE